MRAVVSICLGTSLASAVAAFAAAGCGTGSTAPPSEGGTAACGMLGGTYDKSCNTVSDCTTVSRSCFCGGRPFLGIARTASAAARACENQAASQCTLGCAQSAGGVAEDGKSDHDGGVQVGIIQVLCDLGQCHTVVR